MRIREIFGGIGGAIGRMIGRKPSVESVVGASVPPQRATSAFAMSEPKAPPVAMAATSVAARQAGAAGERASREPSRAGNLVRRTVVCSRADDVQNFLATGWR